MGADLPNLCPGNYVRYGLRSVRNERTIQFKSDHRAVGCCITGVGIFTQCYINRLRRPACQGMNAQGDEKATNHRCRPAGCRVQQGAAGHTVTVDERHEHGRNGVY